MQETTNLGSPSHFSCCTKQPNSNWFSWSTTPSCARQRESAYAPLWEAFATVTSDHESAIAKLQNRHLMSALGNFRHSFNSVPLLLSVCLAGFSLALSSPCVATLLLGVDIVASSAGGALG